MKRFSSSSEGCEWCLSDRFFCSEVFHCICPSTRRFKNQFKFLNVKYRHSRASNNCSNLAAAPELLNAMTWEEREGFHFHAPFYFYICGIVSNRTVTGQSLHCTMLSKDLPVLLFAAHYNPGGFSDSLHLICRRMYYSHLEGGSQWCKKAGLGDRYTGSPQKTWAEGPLNLATK